MNRLALLMQALDYYGLPSNYQRIFTKVGKSGFRPISISDAVSRQTYAWVQINDVDPGYPIDKPYNKDIVCVRNISLDVDFAKDPSKAHHIAVSLSEYISDLFAHPTIPVEDTGGGSHIVIPISGIDTTLYGGGEAINLAIRRTVDELLKPKFFSLCDDQGIDRREIDFGSYDVSRILSAPGTFRPPHPTKPDAPFLKNGYIRRWLDIYDINDIVRIECNGLRDAILDRVASSSSKASSGVSHTPGVVGVGASNGVRVNDPVFEKWLRDWCARNKNVTGNRSDYFYRIVCAALRRSMGVESLVLDHSDLIDELAGGKYGNRAEIEVQRCLDRAKSMPRVRGGILMIQDYIDAFESLGFEFRLNLCGGDIEVNEERMTDAIDARIMNKMFDIGFNNEARIRNVWRDLADQHSYHPVKEYLGSAYLDWDGDNRIDAFVRHMIVDDEKLEHILSNNSFGFDTGHDIAVVWFRRWMIGAVAKAMDMAQNSVLVLEGPQDIGKSYMVRWLCSDISAYHIEQQINLARQENDTNIRATRKWIWEIGELGATTRIQDQDLLKAFLTRQYVTVRKPYGRNDMELPTLASYIGTVNDSGRGIYGDQTGNRRFATIPLRLIDQSYSDKFNPRDLWGEACAAYAAGEPWRMNKEEAATRDEINEMYTVGEPMIELLPRYFHINGSTNRMSASEICLYLKKYGVIRDVDRAHTTQVGIALKKYGLRRVNTGSAASGGRGWVYEGVDVKTPDERAMDDI